MTYDEILKYNIERIKKVFPEAEKTIGITKEQLAEIKSCSVATIDRAISASDSTVIPNYVKGSGRNGRIFFPLLNVGIYLTEQTTVKVS